MMLVSDDCAIIVCIEWYTKSFRTHDPRLTPEGIGTFVDDDRYFFSANDFSLPSLSFRRESANDAVIKARIRKLPMTICRTKSLFRFEPRGFWAGSSSSTLIDW